MRMLGNAKTELDKKINISNMLCMEIKDAQIEADNNKHLILDQKSKQAKLLGKVKENKESMSNEEQNVKLLENELTKARTDTRRKNDEIV